MNNGSPRRPGKAVGDKTDFHHLHLAQPLCPYEEIHRNDLVQERRLYNYPMPTPILTTKLYFPALRPKAVSRPRLIARLNDGLRLGPGFGRRLTLISAPAGFGKTTLVVEWLTPLRQGVSERGNVRAQGQGDGPPETPIQVAWLALDENDRNLADFLTYLIAAFQTVAGEIGGGALRAIQAAPAPADSLPFLLTPLLNEIAACPEPFLLVLDDYHTIASEPSDQALTFLIDHLPPQIHLVITTREDPALPLARYRVRGQLAELRAVDLRFTPAEAGRFLNQAMNLDLSPESIATLEARTEGWIAGLQLAALSLQGRESSERFIRDFSGGHRFVLDYLIAEVLQRQPEAVRSFLLQTALLDRFCAPLCNAITGREDGQEMIEALERANLFLIPLDDQRQWYRYHHLFASVLQARLAEQPARSADLHERASAWYEQNGLRPDAIRHALAAKNFERTAALLELAWPETEAGSIRPVTWLGWVKALPDHLFHARPVLNVAYAYGLLGQGEMEAAQARWKAAEAWLQPAPLTQDPGEMIVADWEQFKALPATIAIARAYLAQALGNIPETIRQARRVLELAPAGNPIRHNQAAMLLGMACWADGDLETAERIFNDYTLKLRTAGNLPDAISTIMVLADIRLALGRLREAVRAVEELLQFVAGRGEPTPPETAELYRGLSRLKLEQGDLEAAARHLQQSQELGEKADLPVWRYRWRIDRARLLAAQGDLNGALALLDEAERLYIRTPLPNLEPVSAQKAQIWAAQGRLSQALEWAWEQELSPADEPGFLREFEYLTLARIRVAQAQQQGEGSLYPVMQLLERMLRAAEKGRRMGSMIAILVLQARAYQVQGSLTPALAALERALILAEPEGYTHVFLSEGQPLVELLARIAAKTTRSSLKEYILQLHAVLGGGSGDSSANSFTPEKSAAAQPVQPPAGQAGWIEPLSQRELEVLRLLRSELSGPEIARECGVSLNTVRTHTQNIYAKLGVNHRRAAVRRAEELNLL